MPERRPAGRDRRDGRRPMMPADLRRVAVVEELDLSADGRTAIVARRTIAGDRYLAHLEVYLLIGRGYRVVLPTSAARRRTAPPGSVHCWVTGAASTRPTSTPSSTTWSASGWPIPRGSASWA